MLEASSLVVVPPEINERWSPCSRPELSTVAPKRLKDKALNEEPLSFVKLDNCSIETSLPTRILCRLLSVLPPCSSNVSPTVTAPVRVLVNVLFDDSTVALPVTYQRGRVGERACCSTASPTFCRQRTGGIADRAVIGAQRMRDVKRAAVRQRAQRRCLAIRVDGDALAKVAVPSFVTPPLPSIVVAPAVRLCWLSTVASSTVRLPSMVAIPAPLFVNAANDCTVALPPTCNVLPLVSVLHDCSSRLWAVRDAAEVRDADSIAIEAESASIVHDAPSLVVLPPEIVNAWSAWISAELSTVAPLNETASADNDTAPLWFVKLDAVTDAAPVTVMVWLLVSVVSSSIVSAPPTVSVPLLPRELAPCAVASPVTLTVPSLVRKPVWSISRASPTVNDPALSR